MSDPSALTTKLPSLLTALVGAVEKRVASAEKGAVDGFAAIRTSLDEIAVAVERRLEDHLDARVKAVLATLFLDLSELEAAIGRLNGDAPNAAKEVDTSSVFKGSGEGSARPGLSGLSDAAPVVTTAPSGATVTVDPAAGTTTHEAADGITTVLQHVTGAITAADAAGKAVPVDHNAAAEAQFAAMDAGVNPVATAEGATPQSHE